MALYYLRVNLTAANIPYTTNDWGRTVIVPQYDENFDYSVSSQASTDRDKGIPQIFYGHNVLPTERGIQSVGYKNVVPATGGTITNAAFTLQTPTLQRVIWTLSTAGYSYVFDADLGVWTFIPVAYGPTPFSTLSTAYLQAQTYVYYSNVGCLIYNTVTKASNLITLISLVPANIIGICAANGYMIAWTSTGVAWSGVNGNILDFTPSLITGANGAQIQEAKGAIITCLPISGGFLIYCEKNVVAAKYSGNVNFPFIFTEVPGSSGITSAEQVSWQANLSEHYAWTTAGMQKLDKTSSSLVFPEASDFLSSLVFEDFNEATSLFTTEKLIVPLSVKVTIIGTRYIVISYGKVLFVYTHALVYDNALKRWGKLKFTHTDCFPYNFPNLSTSLAANPEINKQSFAFMQVTGAIYTVNMEISETTASGVLLLGKYQLQRNAFITHQEATWDTVEAGNTFNYSVIPTLDGKTFLPAKGMFLSSTSPKTRNFLGKVTGQNISLLITGAFNLVSGIVQFTTAGAR